MFVLFDSCWDPSPALGKQRAPTPGVHNSGWLQSPGAKALEDKAGYPRLEAYVKGVVGAFGKDPRVLGWDVWNEPDNTNGGSYAKQEPPNKVDLVLALMPQVYQWARAAGVEQPLTSGVWKGDWSSDDKLSPMERIQLELLRHHLVPQLRQRRGIREAHRVAAAAAPADPVHGIHGARQRQHVQGVAAGRQEI